MENSLKFNWTRINNDTNGNPRYVIHFLNIASDYDKALKFANKLGGRKFDNKQYGGGIVFQTHNPEKTERRILAVLENKA